MFLEFVADHAGLSQTEICENTVMCYQKSKRTCNFINFVEFKTLEHGVKMPDSTWKRYVKREINISKEKTIIF